MALVGEAHVIVRAITDQVGNDIKKGFSKASSSADSDARRAGESLSNSFLRGFNKNQFDNIFTRFSAGLNTAIPGLNRAYNTFHTLIATAYTLQATLSGIVGAIASVVSAFGSLIGSAGGAAASMIVLGNAVFALGSAMAAIKLGFSGIGAAITKSMSTSGAATSSMRAMATAANAVNDAEKRLAQTIQNNRDRIIDANNDVRDAQLKLNAAIKEGQEQIQQAGFSAEDAALAEKRAALNLEDARTKLAAVQDLPPNSRARQEAELAYQEADLAYREAKDRAADAEAEQDRLAKTGVRGTDAVISAQNALAKAEANRAKTVRDAAQDEADAQDALAKARQNAATAGAGGGGGGTDPLAGLTQTQKDFVNFMVKEVMPKVKQLKAAVSDALLPPIQQALTLLIADKPFDVIKSGLVGVSGAVGGAALAIAQSVANADNLSKLSAIFESSAKIITSAGQGLSTLWSIIMTLLSASAPLAERFFNFVNDSFDKFNKYLNSLPEGTLEDFFTRAGDIAADFGKVLGRIFGAFGNLIKANFAEGSPGDQFLKWMAGVQKSGDDLDPTIKNAEDVLRSLGDVIKAIFSQASNPDIGKAFSQFSNQDFLDAIKEIVKVGTDAAPTLAGLVVQVGKLAAAMSESGAIKNFLGTLQELAKIATDFFSSDFGRTLFTIIGQIGAFGTAFFVVNKLVTLYTKGIIGSIMNVSKGIGTTITVVKSLATAPKAIVSAFSGASKTLDGFRQGMAALTYSSNPLAAGIGRVGSAIGTMSQGLKTAATSVASFASTVAGKLGSAFSSMAGGLKTAATSVGSFTSNLAKNAAQGIKTAAVWTGTMLKSLPAMTVALAKNTAAIAVNIAQWIAQKAVLIASKVAGLATAAWQGIVTAAQWLWNVAMDANPIGIIILAIGALVAAIIALAANWDNIVKWITDVWNGFVSWITPGLEAFGEWFSGVWQGISDFFASIWNTVVDVFKAAFNFLLNLFLNWTLLGLIISHWNQIVKFFSDTWNNIVKFFKDAWDNIVKFFTTAIAVFVLAWQTEWKWISDFFSNLWNGISTTFTNIWNGIVSFFQDAWNGMVDWITNAAINYVKFWVDLGQNISDWWNGLWTGIGQFFQDIWNGIVDWGKNLFLGYVSTMMNIFNGVTSWWNGLWNGINTAFQNIWNGIVDFFKGMANGLLGLVEGMVNGIIDIVNGVIKPLNDVAAAVGAVFGQTWSIPTLGHVSLPRLAKGGVVKATPGGVAAIMGEAGQDERVEPLDDNGLSARDRALITALTQNNTGNGVQISVTQLPGESGQELAERISRILAFKQRKGGASFA